MIDIDTARLFVTAQIEEEQMDTVYVREPGTGTMGKYAMCIRNGRMAITACKLRFWTGTESC
jgi:hypothetical protein